MARSKLLILAIGAALTAGGCASIDDCYTTTTPSPQRAVSLSGADGAGRMMARQSRPLAMGTIGSQAQFAQVRDQDDR